MSVLREIWFTPWWPRPHLLKRGRPGSWHCEAHLRSVRNQLGARFALSSVLGVVAMSAFLFLVCLTAATSLLIAFAADEVRHIKRGLPQQA